VICARPGRSIPWDPRREGLSDTSHLYQENPLVTRRRTPPPSIEKPFRLPPDIAIQKEALPDGTAYVFRHRKLGILGRIRIQERAAGGSHLVAEVAGDPADPMTTKRAALFEPLARSVSALLPTDTGALGCADPAARTRRSGTCSAQRANSLSRVR
jgi:hypothetical protein